MAYERVNAAWPAGTNEGRDLKPTAKEARAAAIRLYRFAMKKPWKGAVRIVSGNRHSYGRFGTLQVNPDRHGGGWHELVHGLSHYCAYLLYPNARAHGPQHGFLEREMIEYVVRSGWLDGKLRGKEKPVDRAAEIAARDDAALKRWKTKQKRAETAIRKLKERIARRRKAQGIREESCATSNSATAQPNPAKKPKVIHTAIEAAVRGPSMGG